MALLMTRMLMRKIEKWLKKGLRLLNRQMMLSQMMTSIGQIDVRKVKAHLCEYFGVVGCTLAPLGKLQSPVQYLTLRRA